MADDQKTLASTNSDSFEAIEITVEVPENYDLPPMQEEKELEGRWIYMMCLIVKGDLNGKNR